MLGPQLATGRTTERSSVAAIPFSSILPSLSRPTQLNFPVLFVLFCPPVSCDSRGLNRFGLRSNSLPTQNPTMPKRAKKKKKTSRNNRAHTNRSGLPLFHCFSESVMVAEKAGKTSPSRNAKTYLSSDKESFAFWRPMFLQCIIITITDLVNE